MLSQQIRKHYYYETFGINKQPKVFYVPANKNHTHKFCLSLILEKNLETHNLINSWELCYFADRKKEDIGVKKYVKIIFNGRQHVVNVGMYNRISTICQF